MPKVISITTYLFDELSDKAKEKAREWYRQEQGNISDDSIEQEMLHDLNEGDYGRFFKVRYCLGYCQGDGASINGAISLDNFYTGQKKIREQLQAGFVIMRDEVKTDRLDPRVQIGGHGMRVVNHELYDFWAADISNTSSNAPVTAILPQEDGTTVVERRVPMSDCYKERLKALDAGEAAFDEMARLITAGVELTMKIEQRGRYAHWYSMQVSLDVDSYGTNDEKTHHQLDPAISRVESAFSAWTKKVGQHLEKIGYAVIEIRNSDEVVDETIRMEEYLFTENGSRSYTL